MRQLYPGLWKEEKNTSRIILMANNVIGQFKDEIEEAVGEVASDVKDSVGEAIEQGAQSTVGTPLTPQQLQQQQQDNQQKEIDRQKEIARTRNFLQNIDEAQKRVRMENKQKEDQRLQAQQQEEQDKKIEKVQLQQASKTPGKALRADIAESMPELRSGRGKGG